MNNNSGAAAIALLDLLRCGRRFGEPVSEEVVWCLNMLDVIGICGDDLYVFWGNVCCHSVDEMSSLLRACHEGYSGVSCDTIWQAIACCKKGAVPLGELQLVSEVPGL
jgi:hypothetical protein